MKLKFNQNAQTMSDFRTTEVVFSSFYDTDANKNWLGVLLMLADIREKHCQYNALGNIVVASARWTWGFRGVEVTTTVGAW